QFGQFASAVGHHQLSGRRWQMPDRAVAFGLRHIETQLLVEVIEPDRLQIVAAADRAVRWHEGDQRRLIATAPVVTRYFATRLGLSRAGSDAGSATHARKRRVKAAKAASWPTRIASLFLTLPTRGLTGQHIMPSETECA